MALSWSWHGPKNKILKDHTLWAKLTWPLKLLNPKQNKSKLLGLALLSQNPTTTTVRYSTTTTTTEVSHLLPRPTEKNQLLGPHKRY